MYVNWHLATLYTAILQGSSPIKEINIMKRFLIIYLRIKISEKSLTRPFDVAMRSLSSDKDKTKNWLSIYGLNWRNKEQKKHVWTCNWKNVETC